MRNRKPLARALVAALLIVWAAGPHVTPAAPQTRGGERRRRAERRRPPSLIVALPEDTTTTLVAPQRPDAPPATDVRVVRSRRVALDTRVVGALPRVARPNLLFNERTPGATFSLRLFDDADYNAVVERFETPSEGARAWAGRLSGDAGTFTLVSRGGQLRGNVRAAGAYYEITPSGGAYLVEQLDTSRPKECAGESVRPSPTPDATPAATPTPQESPTPVPEDGSEIDLLVLYTPAAREQAALQARAATNDHATILARIDTYAVETNAAYANSGVATRVRVAHRAEVSYTADSQGGARMSDILDQLNASGDALDEAHTLRDAHRADVVLLIVRDDNEGGLANGMMSPLRNPSFAMRAFGVVEWWTASSIFNFAHELGHIQGTHHNREDTQWQSGVYCYSHGYRFELGGARFRTIMSYEERFRPSEMLPHFSNPDVTFERNGRRHATGVAINDPDPEGPTDNALTINNTRRLVANFRNRNAP